MKAIKRISLSALAAFTMACSPENKAPEKPNILFVLVDDLGYGDLGVTGSDYYETPNIDALAEAAVQFDRGYAACAVCSPSRASIMTGQFAATHGITNWIGEKSGEAWRIMGRHDQLLPAEYEHKLSKEATTLPEVFQAAGYTTFFAGKWHLGGKGSWPEDHGFDINVGGYESGGPRGGYYAPYNNPNLKWKKKGENLTMRLAEETAAFMESHKDSSFFAFLSFYAVHGPIQTDSLSWRKYREKAVEQGLLDEGFAMEQVLPARQKQDNPVYAGLVAQMDAAVGVVMEQLKKSGLDKNTIVVFTGDNGGVVSGDNYSTNLAPLRGGKGYQFEGGIREPFFVYVPWLDESVDHVDTPVMSVDLYPTLLELAGIENTAGAQLEGSNIIPLMKGQSIAERPLFWHYPHYGNQGGKPHSIIMKGDWKLIWHWEKERSFLYNVATDISEQNDVSEANPEMTAALQQELFDYLERVNAKKPVRDPEFDAEKRAKYEEYLAGELKEGLEKQRERMLSDDFIPNKDWWSSKPTID